MFALRSSLLVRRTPVKGSGFVWSDPALAADGPMLAASYAARVQLSVG